MGARAQELANIEMGVLLPLIETPRVSPTSSSLPVERQLL